jgi:hypothetical protein
MPGCLLPLAVIFSLFRELWDLFKKPQYRSVVVWVCIILLIGMIFYRQVEGWSWLDALYFSVITLSTVGYGDLSPSTPEAKIFTMVYIFLGVSIIVSFASMLVKDRQDIHRQRFKKENGETDG